MLKVIGCRSPSFMTFLGAWLQTMGQGNAIVLAAILGAMIAFDMGGPVNKAAFFFGAAMIKEGNYAIMGACAAAICTPPLGLALATLIEPPPVDRGAEGVGPRGARHGDGGHHRGRHPVCGGRSRCA